jgi:hypothetical protein
MGWLAGKVKYEKFTGCFTNWSSKCFQRESTSTTPAQTNDVQIRTISSLSLESSTSPRIMLLLGEPVGSPIAPKVIHTQAKT